MRDAPARRRLRKNDRACRRGGWCGSVWAWVRIETHDRVIREESRRRRTERGVCAGAKVRLGEEDFLWGDGACQRDAERPEWRGETVAEGRVHLWVRTLTLIIWSFWAERIGWCTGPKRGTCENGIV